MIGTLQLLALAALAFLALAGLAASPIAHAVMRWTAGWRPAVRHRALVLVAIAPIGLSINGVLAVLLPSVWPGHDHCLDHSGHPHLCVVHVAGYIGGWTAGLLAAAVAAIAAYAGVAIGSLRRAAKLLERLSRSARFDAPTRAWIVPAAEPLCMSVGIVRPRVVVSEGLLGQASPGELEVMLSHERAHHGRRDTLVRLIARASTLSMWPSARSKLLAAIDLSCERACDEEAATRVGDRLRVAEALLAMERRLAGAPAHPFALAFGSSDVPARVEALLAPPQREGNGALLVSMFVAGAVAVLALHDHIHHATETALALLIFR